MGGESWAKDGVKRVVRAMAQPATTWEQAQESYRKLLFMLGEQTGVDEAGNPTRPGLKPQEVLEVLQKGGQVAPGELLQCRVRYLTDTVVLGGRIFVEDIVARRRNCFAAKQPNVRPACPSLQGFHIPRGLCGPAVLSPTAA